MKYNLDKLEKDRDTFIYGDHGNIRDSAYIYSRKYNLKIKVKKLADGSMVTLLEGEHPIIVKRNRYIKVKDNFFTKSDIIIPLDKEQVEIMINHRNDLDQRMINNVDNYTKKLRLFNYTTKITSFINQNQNIK